jgi:peptide deformylase
VEENDADLQHLIDDMIETMHAADGIGLAAPQVGRTERVFVIDLGGLRSELIEQGEIIPEQPMVFVNPEIVSESDDEEEFEEGCLSIPDIREFVSRPGSILVRFRDRAWEQNELRASGMLARVIQHEYDHLEGVLFVDRISAFRRRLLRRRLKEMAEGNVSAEYVLAPPSKV